MFIDARTLPESNVVDCDVCVIGAGAAGIPLVGAIIGTGRRVCLVEAGGFELDDVTQDYYRGQLDGSDIREDYLTGTRLRVFGGSLMAWGGYCLVLDEIDFEPKPWLSDYPGWPFGRKELIPWYERAAAILEVPLFFEAGGPNRPCPGEGSGLSSTPLHLSPPVYLGAIYREPFTEADNLTVLLHANARELLPSQSGGHIDRLLVVAGNRKMTVRAGTYVLATGGIEAPRILLNSNSITPNGVGNDRDLVGRFFMSHFPVMLGRALLIGPDPEEFLDSLMQPQPRYVTVDETVRRRMKLLGAGFQLNPYLQEGFKGRLPDSMEKVFPMFQSLIQGQVWFRMVPVLGVPEHAPNRESRVMLGEERDDTGMRRIRLQFRRSPVDAASFRASAEYVGRELGRLSLGRLQTAFTDYSEPPLRPDDHHLGTTRMHPDPSRGVVDANCRVHGIDNLYVTGGSVFPSGGFANPALTIVALALRLADHLKGRPDGR